MKVILNQTVPKVGKEGQIVNVADGFARNFLFPRGLAILADKSQIAVLERRLEKVKAETASQLSSAQELREKLNGKTVKIEGKVGTGTKLFGAVTSQDVADAIKSQLSQDLDRKKIAMVQPIKRLGVHQVELDLHPEVDAVISVNVFDPNAPVLAHEEISDEEAEKLAEEQHAEEAAAGGEDTEAG